jgi:hypothetical protein
VKATKLGNAAQTQSKPNSVAAQKASIAMMIKPSTSAATQYFYSFLHTALFWYASDEMQLKSSRARSTSAKDLDLKKLP